MQTGFVAFGVGGAAGGSGGAVLVEPCPVGHSCTGGENMGKCKAGEYQDLLGQPACKSCPTGRYGDETGTTTCIQCTEGMFMANSGSSTSCEACKVGESYQPEKGKASCIPDACEPGTFAVSATAGVPTLAIKRTDCLNCHLGKYSGARGLKSASGCNDCPIGTYAKDNTGGATGLTQLSDCTLCGAGNYGAEAGQISNTVACTSCAAGRFQAAVGQAACGACKAGTYNAETGQSSISKCVGCGKGKYSSAQGATAESQCNLCGAGKYSDQVAQTCDGHRHRGTGARTCATRGSTVRKQGRSQTR